MAPKRPRQPNKSVTIYNSNSMLKLGSKKEKKIASIDEQKRNNIENWEFHFKIEDLDEVMNVIKCKDLAGTPLLIGATVLNHKDLVLNILKHGYNVNEPDKHKMTPLYWAVKLKHLEMVDILLLNKANPTLKPNNGDELIFVALASSLWDEESFMLLWNYLKNSGLYQVNSVNKNGLSMLHLAVRREWNILVDVLITCDVDVNVSNPHGITPLMLACYRNDYSIASKLIAKGALVSTQNSVGFTALCYAFSAAITKNLSPPFLLIDKLRAELAKEIVTLKDYIKDRLKIITHLPKISKNSDQPNTELILQHVFSFLLCNTLEVLEIIFEINVVKIITESIDKYFGNKEHVKLCLILLLTILRNLPFNPKFIAQRLDFEDVLINSGCFDVCTEVCKSYNDDNYMVFLANSSITFSNFIPEIGEKWLKNNADDLYHYNKMYLKNLPDADLTPVDYDMFHEKALDLQSKLALNVNPKKTITEENKTNVSCKEKPIIEKSSMSSSNSKRSKRRNKNSRNNQRRKSETLPENPDEQCVNAIKQAINFLLDEDETNKPEGNNGGDYVSNWKRTVLSFPFKNKICLDVSRDLETGIKYLENLFGLIVNKYKSFWEMDCAFEDSDNEEIGCPKIDEVVRLQNQERDDLCVFHKEFYHLIGNVRKTYSVDPHSSEKVIKELEKLLLTHSIRGETILNEAAAMEAIKITTNDPNNPNLGKYMQDVLNNKVPENKNIHIEISEHLTSVKKVDHTIEEDACLNDISALTALKCECNSSTSSNDNYYHLTNSILNICEDGEDFSGSNCCNKGCTKNLNENEPKDSRWGSLMRSLEMMDDSQVFFNGKIRISNAEKRKNHELTPSGNFGPLEIGLGVDKLPLAVRFVPKSDICAPLLKIQIEQVLNLNHKNVLKFYSCGWDLNYLVIATPLCEYNLGEYVHRIKRMQLKVCKVDMIRQILNGLMFLHDCDEPVVHGSLKPSNVFVDVNGVFKLAEFGIHKALSTFKNLPESTIIWFATESYKQYKQHKLVECTCASDIQVAGMLVHFVENFGGHAFGNEVLEILKNLEKATPQIYSKDLELYDLLTWMLMGEPSERPTIHQVLSHIYFWSNAKKWTYILACAGLGQKTNIPLDVELLHQSLDKIAMKENIIGNCWILTAKKHYPQAAFIDCKDTPSGLLKFIKYVKDYNVVMPKDDKQNISTFILNAFPHFALSLYRMIENTEWSDHRMFMPFHNVQIE